MKLQGERTIPAPVAKTWEALNDPETLKACITGCESIESTGENEYLAIMAVRIGPVNARFKGRLQLTDIVPLTSYKILFDGQGGVAGFGKGSADVQLSELDGGAATRLVYTADAQIGGKLAQIGSRLVESAAAKIADEFFGKFEQRMIEQSNPADTGDTAAGGTAGNVAGDAAVAPTAGAADPASVPAPAVASAAATARAPFPSPSPVATGGSTSPDGPGNRWWVWIAGVVVIALLLYFIGR